MMSEEQYEILAAQLRKPSGEMGTDIGKWMNDGNRKMNEETIKLLAPQENDTILELGMGNGAFVKEILNKAETIKYTGCDYSELMVEEAGRRNKEYVDKGRCEFVHADAAGLPFQEAMFKKVFSINTIYFWSDPARVLSELRRVLQPGGLIALAFRPAIEMMNYPFVKYNFTLYEAKNVIDMLGHNGFTNAREYAFEDTDGEFNGQLLKRNFIITTAEKASGK
jgi:ubiquinone/menaquinone biosynthesis C-methylase UbiE